MHIFEYVGKLFLALYLIFVGLEGVGISFPFVTPVVVGVLALITGIVFLVKVIQCWGHCCGTCDKSDKS